MIRLISIQEKRLRNSLPLRSILTSSTKPKTTDRNTYIVSNVIPPRLVSIVRKSPDTETTAADALMWLVTFSEPVINVDSGDFDVTGSVANVVGVVSVGLGTPGTPSLAYFVAVQGGDLDLLKGIVTLTLKDGRNIADSAGNPLTNESPIVRTLPRRGAEALPWPHRSNSERPHGRV